MNNNRSLLCRAPLMCAMVLILLSFYGCGTVGYYWQSVRGQFDIWGREQPIAEMIDAPATPAALKQKLVFALKAREFASAQLALPNNASYQRYANLERPYVVWNVFATPEFSTLPLNWCFVMAGCVSYRGYFAKTDAEAFAKHAADEGNDIYVGGVPAYSTLGWFADPVLNTFVNYPPVELARIIFHELAHQVVYVKGDTVFNESFAVTVEREGLRRWLAANGGDQDRRMVQAMRTQRADFVALVQRYRVKLEALYKQGREAGTAPEPLRAAKQSAFAAMREDYAVLKARWGGYAGYDPWFAAPPSNARLASVNLYSEKVPAFEAMLEQQGRDLPKFYDAVKALAREDKAVRDARLDAWAKTAAEVAAEVAADAL